MTFKYLSAENTFPVKMAFLRNKGNFAALNKENWEEHARTNLAQNSNVPRSHEHYITQVSEEIEGRVTKNLPQEFNIRENGLLGALARLDDFVMNPLFQGLSGSVPQTSQNALSTNQGTTVDDSQSDLQPEAGVFHNQMTQDSGQKLVTTWWQEFTRKSHTAPPVNFLGSRKRTNLPGSPNFEVGITLRQLKQTILVGLSALGKI